MVRFNSFFAACFFRRWNFLFLAGILFLFLAFLSLSPGPEAVAAPLYQSEGQKIFEQKCVGCHTIGGGKLVGPDLQGVATRQDPAWIKNFITDPAKVIASGDPTATQLVAQYGITMPTLGLSSAEVDALVTFLENPGTTITAAPTAAPSAAQPGAAVPDPIRGQQIFTGGLKLSMGGYPCISCHTVEGVGQFGGGSLGPNLTHVIQRYGGQAGMATTLATLPFPTMAGVFATRPLSAAEQADLLAFFVKADQTQPVVPLQKPFLLPMWAFGGAGLVVFLLFLTLFWPRQSRTMVQIIRAKSKEKHR